MSSNVVSIYAQENNRNYLTFRSTKSTKSKIQIENIGGNNPDIEYSTDGTNWTQFENKKAVEVNEAIYVRGNNPDGFSKSDNKYTKFKVTNSPEVTGSIMSLIDGEGKQTEIPCDYCFYSLFSSCTTLMTVPELTATTLTEGCYKLMFSGCTNITTMPNLPATKLATSCYESMFSGCTKLKVTKPLIAETIVAGCYKEMFSGCTKVNNVVVNFNNWEENATTDWLTNTASTGSIICSKQLETEVISKIIPENWTLVTPDYLKITAQEDNVDIELNSYGTAKCNIEYSFDGLFFTPYTAGDAINLPNQGDCVYLSGNNPSKFSSSSTNYHQFIITKNASASGSVMSLIDRYGITTNIPNTNCFYRLFADCKITTPPLLPATGLKDNCYNSMFYGCTSLIQAPELNATTLAKQCYKSMFYGCTSLVDAPELNATSTISGCYSNMFEDCSSLKNIKISFSQWQDADNKSFTTSWLKNVPEGGVCIGPEDLDLKSRSQSSIPSSWYVNPHKVYIKDGETEYFSIENQSVYSMRDKVSVKLTSNVPTIKGYDKGVSAKTLNTQSNIEITKNTAGYYFYMPNEDVEISVIYTPKEYTITEGEYVKCDVKTATVESDAITFTVTDRTSDGYELSNVKIGSTSIPFDNYAGTFLMSDFAKDVTITAAYTLIKYDVFKDENITNLSKTKPTIKDTVRFKIKDLTSKGYALKNILVNGSPKISQNLIDSVIMSKYICNIELKAEYEPITFTISTEEYITCNTKTATVESESIPFTVTDRTAEGYELTKVAIGSKSIPFENYAGSFNMSDFVKDVVLTATYSPIKYQITKDENISCRKTTGTVKDTIRFTIKDLTSKGYAFKRLFVNGIPRTCQELSDSVIVAKYLCDINLATEYEPITLSITAGEFVNCNTKTATVESEAITFTVTDRTSDGYELSNVKIGTKTIPIENFAGSFLMSDFAKDVTITATYSAIKYQITKDENITCRKTTATVEDKITFTIKNLTAIGWQPKKVLVNSKEISFQDYSASFKMKDFLCDVNITTEYEPITFTISTEEYITCNTKTATVESESIPFTVTDRTAEGYELTKVAIGSKSIPFENYAGSFNMSDFVKDVVLTATYSPIKYQITKDENISCRKTTGTVKDTIRFTIKDLTSKGYAFKRLFVNGIPRTCQELSDSVIVAKYLCDINLATEYEPITLSITAGEFVNCNTKTATVESEAITFTVTDRTSDGYELSNVKIGTKTIPIENFAGSFLMSDFAKDVTITATYSAIKYQITKDENITCRKTTATVNDSVYFTIKDYSNSGLAVENILINSKPINYKKEKPGIDMKDFKCDVYISVEYKQLDYKITTDPNITSDHQFASINDLIKINAKDLTSDGYELEKIFVNGSSVTFYKNFCNFLMSEYKSDVEITTKYKPISYKVKADRYVFTDKNSATVNDTIFFSVDDLSEDGRIFEYILVNGKQVDIKTFNDTIFMSDYISDITIEAVYSKYHSIKTDNNITEISHTTAQKDEQIQFKIIPANNGYEPFVYVNSRRIFSPDSINYTFSMFDNDVDIYVDYQEIVVEESETQEDNQAESEPEVIKGNRPKAINKIKVYPSLAKEGEIITISLENVDSEYLNNSKIIIFEITGKSIKTFDNPQEISKIIMPNGLYKGVFISGVKKIRFDFAILK